MIEEQDKTSENKPERDENGRLLPGNTANPNGRPKGTVSITDAIRRKLEEMAPLANNEEKRTYLEVLIVRIMNKAIVDGDQQMITRIWNYIDGMPKQSIEHSGKMSLEEFLSENKNDGSETGDDKE